MDENKYNAESIANNYNNNNFNINNNNNNSNIPYGFVAFNNNQDIVNKSHTIRGTLKNDNYLNNGISYTQNQYFATNVINNTNSYNYNYNNDYNFQNNLYNNNDNNNYHELNSYSQEFDNAIGYQYDTNSYNLDGVNMLYSSNNNDNNNDNNNYNYNDSSSTNYEVEPANYDTYNANNYEDLSTYEDKYDDELISKENDLQKNDLFDSLSNDYKINKEENNTVNTNNKNITNENTTSSTSKFVSDIKTYYKQYAEIIVSTTIIIVCSVIYLFIVSDTSIAKNGLNNKIKVEHTEKFEADEDIAEDELEEKDSETIKKEINALKVIDSTKTNNPNSIITASYNIKELDYYNSSIVVPYINLKSDDAKKVNEEIKTLYKAWAYESAKYKKAFSSSELDAAKVIRSSYEVYNYDNITAVLLTFVTREDSLETNIYYAYSFNKSNSSLLISTNEDLISLTEGKEKEDDTKDSSNDNSNNENSDSDNESNEENKEENKNSSKNNNYGKLLTYQELLSKLNYSYEEIDTKYKKILRSYAGEYGDSNSIDNTLILYNELVEDKKLNAFINNDGELCIISKIFTPLYENGTYRIFKYTDDEFEALLLKED